MTHPSFLQLDRHALGVKSADVEAHLPGCEPCRLHLARLAQPVAVPVLASPSRSRGWWLLGLVPLAASLLVLVPGSETRAKGAPSVAVYVRHGGQVTRWDGKTRFAEGDAVQLEVAPSGYSHLLVAQGASVLFESDLEGDKPLMVPRSWTLTGESGPEQLKVVFTRASLSSDEVQHLPTVLQTERMWVVTLELPR